MGMAKVSRAGGALNCSFIQHDRVGGWSEGSDFKNPFVRTLYVDARAGEDTSGA